MGYDYELWEATDGWQQSRDEYLEAVEEAKQRQQEADARAHEYMNGVRQEAGVA